MSSGSFKNVINKMCLHIIYLEFLYEEDLALNNLQWLICHKNKPNQTKPFNFNLCEIELFEIDHLIFCLII